MTLSELAARPFFRSWNLKEAVEYGHDEQTIEDGSPLWTVCEPWDLNFRGVPLRRQQIFGASRPTRFTGELAVAQVRFALG
jgi:hypothetical protein